MIAAWVQLREGTTADPEELRAFARGRIAHFKIPRHVWIVREFPTTVTGKIQKFRMRGIASAALASAPDRVAGE